MPLVILSGYPASGLSTRARELETHFNHRLGEEIKSVVVIDDAELGITKTDYRERDPEKAARGAQMAAVKRHLSKDTLVILDSLAYIKGFRYQLFCEARALNTMSCVVHVGTPVDQCRTFNCELAQQDNGWPEDLFNALVFRYEEPNAMTRWDSPLYILLPEDRVPIADIWASLIYKKPPPPNQATTIKPAAPANYLSALNEITAEVVKTLVDLHRDAPGAQITIDEKRIVLPYELTLPQINRIRRNFIQLNKSATMPVGNIKLFFIDFVVNNWNNE